MFIDVYNDCYFFHHTSEKPFLGFDEQAVYNQHIGTKPKGIWFCFGHKNSKHDTLEEYCIQHRGINTQFASIINKVQIGIDLPFYKKLLYIQNVYDVFNIERHYGVVKEDKTHLDWTKIAKKYIGIVLFEQEQGCLLNYGFQKDKTGSHNNWLETWSLYGGCIWEPKYLKIIKEWEYNG